jgi:hypothetical protein
MKEITIKSKSTGAIASVKVEAIPAPYYLHTTPGGTLYLKKTNEKKPVAMQVKGVFNITHFDFQRLQRPAANE